MIALPTLATPQTVGTTLGDLLGTPVQAKACSALADSDCAAVAAFSNSSGATVAALRADFAFAARSGAALSLIPSDVADECAEDKDLTKVMVENFQEVLNIAGVLFTPPKGDAARLSSVHMPASDAPSEVSELLSAPGEHVDYEVDIEGYGVGHLSLFVKSSD